MQIIHCAACATAKHIPVEGQAKREMYRFVIKCKEEKGEREMEQPINTKKMDLHAVNVNDTDMTITWNRLNPFHNEVGPCVGVKVK